MTILLRIMLLIAALIIAAWILSKIKKNRVKMGDAIFWFSMAILLLIMGGFPEISYKLATLFGFQAPVNFVFLLVIGLLIEKLFNVSIKLSQLEDKVTVLSGELALRTREQMQDEVTTQEPTQVVLLQEEAIKAELPQKEADQNALPEKEQIHAALPQREKVPEVLPLQRENSRKEFLQKE